MKCESCAEKCPQEKLTCEIAKGRMHATDEVIELQRQLEEYKALEEQGMLFRLPCKAGDTIYVIDDRKLHMLKADNDIALVSGELCIFAENSRFADCISYSDLGKRAFLVKEDAEKRLEEMKHMVRFYIVSEQHFSTSDALSEAIKILDGANVPNDLDEGDRIMVSDEYADEACGVLDENGIRYSII